MLLRKNNLPRLLRFLSYKFFISLVVVLCFNYLVSLSAFAFDTRAKSAILIDLQSGSVLFEKNSQERISPASMTKIVTALVAFSGLTKGVIDEDTLFLVSEKAWKAEGSRMFLEVGDSVTIDKLLLGLTVQSGNDAAITIAEGIAGTEESFAKLMNEYVKEIGVNNSNFTNASGLPDPDHYSTAYDLALISKNLIDNFPMLYQLFAKKEYKYNGINQKNRNLLLGSFVGADGIKTGYTKDSGYSAVYSVVRKDRRLLLVETGLSSDQERYYEAKRIFDWGFFSWRNIKVVSLGQEITNLPVALGQEKSITALANADVYLSVPAFNTTVTEYNLEYNSPIIAPINKSDIIAKLTIKNGKMEKDIELLAKEPILRVGYFGNIAAHFTSFFDDYQ